MASANTRFCQICGASARRRPHGALGCSESDAHIGDARTGKWCHLGPLEPTPAELAEAERIACEVGDLPDDDPWEVDPGYEGATLFHAYPVISARIAVKAHVVGAHVVVHASVHDPTSSTRGALWTVSCRHSGWAYIQAIQSLDVALVLARLADEWVGRGLERDELGRALFVPLRGRPDLLSQKGLRCGPQRDPACGPPTHGERGSA